MSIESIDSSALGSLAAAAAGLAPAQVEAPVETEAWCAQAQLVMTALEAGEFGGHPLDRRAMRRRTYHVKAGLRLFSDPPRTPPWLLYTRDVHARGLGFISPHRLPLGYGGILHLPAPSGAIVAVAATLLRCREAAPGWFEGSVYFNREQPEFAA